MIGSIELIHPSSTARNDSVMARVIRVTSIAEWVPTGGPYERRWWDADSFADVLIDEMECASWFSTGVP